VLETIKLWLVDAWPAFVSVAHVAAAAWVTVDAVLRKRQTASVIGWVGLAWLAPLMGSLAYLAFGINRIQRKAVALELRSAWTEDGQTTTAPQVEIRDTGLAARHHAAVGLASLGHQLTGNRLRPGNRIELLENGDQAFPAMIAAIDGAHRSLTLLTYIFDNDRAGHAFVDALQRAVHRGVEVRVLIDDVGSRYTRPTMPSVLRKVGVPVAAFLRTRIPRLFKYANLRNHRKILVADGATGFVGGTNIREGHWLALDPEDPVQCIHFRIAGPVVTDLQQTFAIDWAHTTGERLQGRTWFCDVGPVGPVIARGVADGPDEDLDKMPEMLLGALSAATRHVRLVTPYFLPDDVLARALRVAAMRGVEVDVVLPARSNLPLMDWAMAPQLPWLLEKGCRIHLTPPPFDHSKLLVIDSFWSLIGSTNWDARSLRLNFEYNVECYDEDLARRLEAVADRKIAAGRELRLEELRSRSMAVQLRNGLARLLSPYL